MGSSLKEPQDPHPGAVPGGDKDRQDTWSVLRSHTEALLSDRPPSGLGYLALSPQQGLQCGEGRS